MAIENKYISICNGDFLLIAMPNRARKLLVNKKLPKEKRCEFGLDYDPMCCSIRKKLIKIQKEYTDSILHDYRPIGFQAHYGSDLYLGWEKKNG